MSKFSHNRRSRGPSQRQLRVGEMLRHALVDIFAQGRIQDDDLRGQSITVSEVTVSPDMRNATVFCTALGGRDNGRVIAALNRCKNFFRGELGHTITLKFTPALTFREDTSFREAEAMSSLFNSPKVSRDLGDQEAEPDDGAQA